MKLAIIGSRTCPPVDIEAYLKYIPDTIVSGGARGADTYAKEFANKPWHSLNYTPIDNESLFFKDASVLSTLFDNAIQKMNAVK